MRTAQLGACLNNQFFLLFAAGDTEVGSPYIPVASDIAQATAGENSMLVIENDLVFQWNGTTKQFSVKNISATNNASAEWNATSYRNGTPIENFTQANIPIVQSGPLIYFTNDGVIDSNQNLFFSSDKLEIILTLTAPNTQKLILELLVFRALSALSLVGVYRPRSV